MGKTAEVTAITQAEVANTIQQQLYTLSHQALHLKATPSSENVNKILAQIQTTRSLLTSSIKPDHPFAHYTHAHLGAHILHTAHIAKQKGIFTPKQTEGYVADGHQEADRALASQQLADIQNTQQGRYMSNTLRTLQDIMPLIGPLPEEQRTHFEFVFAMEKQRLQQFGGFPQDTVTAQKLIQEITAALTFYKNPYADLESVSQENVPKPAPATDRFRRQQLQPIPRYDLPPRVQRQNPQYPDAYPQYPQPRYHEPQPRQYYPEPPPYMQPRGDYLNHWPWLPQRDATHDESMGLPHYGPQRRDQGRR